MDPGVSRTSSVSSYRGATTALLAGALCLGGCGPSESVTPDPDPDAVFANLAPGILLAEEDFGGWTLAERMERAEAPAVAVTFVGNGGPAWTRAVGVLRASDGSDERPTAAGPDTRFLGKSLAKPITAFATLRLVEQGTLDLDTPLDRYLERWSLPDNEFTRARPPTLRQLLAHRAGFTMWGVPSYGPGEELPTLLQALNGEPPAEDRAVTIDYEPGTRSRYSGGGYSVLQLLLEDVTGEEFPALMERLVLDPIGMDHSLFNPGVPDYLRPVTAAGHEDGEPLEGWEALVQMAAGGLITTAPDMGRFVAEVNRAYAGRSELLSAATAREMLTDHGDGRGLGFVVEGSADSLVFSHTGSGDGFRTLIVGVPARGEGLAVLVNADDARAGELRQEIVRAVALERGWPELVPEVRQVADVGRPWLERLAGRYEYSDGSATTIVLTPEGLTAAWGESDPVRIFPRDSVSFFNRAGESFAFEAGDEGDIAALTWSGDFGAFRAERAEETKRPHRDFN